MSRKHCDYYSNQPAAYSGCGCGNETRGSGIGLVGLVILILIILQFRKDGRYKKDYECDDYDDYDDKYESDYEEHDYDEYEDEKECRRDCTPAVDNGILFIIALFYLACCSKKWC